METLSLQNLRRLQTRRGEENLKPSRKHKLRKHTMEAFAEEEVDEEDDEVIDRELERV
jgi:hypothetical protein